MNIHEKSRYHEVHARSLRDPEGFWAEAAREIDWIEPAKKIFDPSMGLYGRWFAGAVVNTCYNALDRHVAGGRADQVALIHDSPLAGAYHQIHLCRDAATRCRRSPPSCRISASPRATASSSICRWCRKPWSRCWPARGSARCTRVVFGGFAAKELATRIDDAKPKLIFSASCGLEPGRIVQYKPLLDEAIKLSSAKPQACIILQRPQQSCDLTAGRDHDWATLRRAALDAGKTAALRAGARDRSALHPLHLGHDRASRRAWCATMAGIWSR